MRVEELVPDEAVELYFASLFSVSAPAMELERMGLSNYEDSLIDAKRLKPMLLAEAERAMNQ